MPSEQERLLVAATKPELFILDSAELNAETPAHLLDDEITPLSRLFARNTGQLPAFDAREIAAWTLRIDECVREARTWTLDQLKTEFAPVTRIAVLECAGNGRAFFPDHAGTILWQRGAVGCVAWTGVKLGDLLAACGLTPEAVYTAHHSPDRALAGDGPAISRGVPIAKALAGETIVAWAANGEPIPLLHGGPLRVIVPGYPGSASQKWIARIEIRDREHDGERMTNLHYRLPRAPVRSGDALDPADFEVITDMPVKSVITSPRDGFTASAGQPLAMRGFAWSGHTPVKAVEVSFDGGASWRNADLGTLPDTFAWRRFTATLDNLPAGDIEIVARATDTQGLAQPLQSALWNPRGYCNNMAHRVRGRIAERG
jgi:DMSO/TMAO reductase YedYZ molybdopterin-dependent catalytic subunit